MWIRRTILISSTIFFFIFLWNVQSSNSLDINFIKSANLTLYDVVILLNNSAFGYSSIQAYTLFYTIPFIIFYNLFYRPESLEVLVRSKSRDGVFKARVVKGMFAAFIFSLIHTLVNLGLTSIYIENSVLKEMNFTFVSFCNMVGLFLFYTFIGLLYELLGDKFRSSGLPLILTLLLIGGLFFIEKLVFNQTWGPLKDLVIYTKLLQGEWGLMDVNYTYVRQLLIVIFIYLISSSVFQRKDYM
nr:WxPxxD family membrane protein [Fredinandcohnia onubensis]